MYPGTRSSHSLRRARALGAALVLLGCTALAGSARADIFSGDFEEDLDLPSGGSSGPRVLQATGKALGMGFELDEADEVSNPSDWEDSLRVDLTPTLLTLQPTRDDEYQTITLTISNITFTQPGEQITGFQLLTNNAVVMDGTDTFTTAYSFTANSLTVTYTADDYVDGHQFVFPDGTSTSTFSVTTAVVPEPSTWALMLGGLGLLGGVRRLRRARCA